MTSQARELQVKEDEQSEYEYTNYYFIAIIIS